MLIVLILFLAHLPLQHRSFIEKSKAGLNLDLSAFSPTRQSRSGIRIRQHEAWGINKMPAGDWAIMAGKSTDLTPEQEIKDLQEKLKLMDQLVDQLRRRAQGAETDRDQLLRRLMLQDPNIDPWYFSLTGVKRKEDPYQNETFVIAIEIGATDSTVAYSQISDGVDSVIRTVTSWPGLHRTRIPSVIVYDELGSAAAFGAEANSELWDFAVSDKEAVRIALTNPAFDLDACNSRKPSDFPPPSLPNLSVQRCFTDFIRYLFSQFKVFYLNHTPDGQTLWESFGTRFELILTYPDHWNLRQQEMLRNAAIIAGFPNGAPPSDFASVAPRLHLLRRFEGALASALHEADQETKGSRPSWLEKSSLLVVVDPGELHVASAVYSVESNEPEVFVKEVGSSECIDSGLSSVSEGLAAFLREKLKDTQYGLPPEIEHIVGLFDSKIKLWFDDPTERHFIKFGLNSENMPELSIRRGRLEVLGSEIESFFKPAVASIVRLVRRRLHDVDSSDHKKFLLLLGSAGELPYLRRKLTSVFEFDNIAFVPALYAPPGAVSRGAVASFCRDLKSCVVTTMEYGVVTKRPYRDDLVAAGRPVLTISHKRWYPGGWKLLVPKGTRLKRDSLFEYQDWVRRSKSDSLTYTLKIITYQSSDGSSTPAADVHDGWCRDASDRLLSGFREHYSISADLTKLSQSTPLRRDSKGEWYQECDFKIGMNFAVEPIKAYLIWEDRDGKTIMEEAKTSVIE